MSFAYLVKNVMTQPTITVDSETSVNEAIRMMVKNDIGALAVTEKDKHIGMITERDIQNKCCLKERKCMTLQVKEIVSRPLVTIDAATPIGVAAGIMIDKQIRRLLVTEKEEIVGIVTQKDLLNGTLEAFQSLQSVLHTM